MDAMDRSYSRFCSNKIEREKKTGELELTMNTWSIYFLVR
jgi:hypothetical protein